MTFFVLYYTNEIDTKKRTMSATISFNKLFRLFYDDVYCVDFSALIETTNI